MKRKIDAFFQKLSLGEGWGGVISSSRLTLCCLLLYLVMGAVVLGQGWQQFRDWQQLHTLDQAISGRERPKMFHPEATESWLLKQEGLPSVEGNQIVGTFDGTALCRLISLYEDPLSPFDISSFYCSEKGGSYEVTLKVKERSCASLA